MTTALLSAMALTALAGVARAQTIEFQLFERNNQHSAVNGGTAAANDDAILDFAVRARVTSTNHSLLSGFGFDVAIPGEADANGTLSHGTISNVDGTYFTGLQAAASPMTGVHGLARQYTYLAGIGANFNGAVNISVGTFTNSPSSQEIGLVTGLGQGATLLGTPGVDPLGDGNPSTYSPYGVHAVPSEGATAALTPSIGAAYFAEGTFVDVFRFRYTVTNFTYRSFDVSLRSVSAQIATQFVFRNSAWALDSTTFTGALVIPWTVNVGAFPSPSAASLFACCAALAAHRRRRPTPLA
jgi:hypothetical protein